MTAHALNINNFRTRLSTFSTNEEMAEIISSTFEQIKYDHDALKKEILGVITTVIFKHA